MPRRILQFTLLVVQVVVVSAWLLLGDGPNIRPVGRNDLPHALPIILWWTAPALLLFLHRTWVWALFAGGVLIAASNAALLFIYSSTGSTSAVGFLVLPPVGLLMAMSLLAAEWALGEPWWP